MLGNRCIKTYSQMQETIALSSGESECYGSLKTAAMCLGVKDIMEDPGIGVEAQVNTDPSTAKNITARRGAGRVRRTTAVGTRSCGER